MLPDSFQSIANSHFLMLSPKSPNTSPSPIVISKTLLLSHPMAPHVVCSPSLQHKLLKYRHLPGGFWLEGTAIHDL